ncbi:MAG: DnaJ domain-containing protein [Deltaproteobacteria bacterium]|jgi:DnaJ-class molecular chaperone|nr:DnaJ domain-containing protein [Deltaproteobacteria bacterium]
MSQLQAYQELSLKPGASELEIRAAFRRLAKEYHPDSSAHGGDAQKFQKAHQAYQNLLAKARSSRKTQNALNGVQFQFISQSQNGLDIHYELALVKSSATFTLAIPRTVHQVCPRCFGEGRTLVQMNQGSIYRPSVCPRCGGEGKLARTSHLMVQVTPAMVERGKIRLKGAGAQDDKSGQSGDLYVNLNFVERLAKSH